MSRMRFINTLVPIVVHHGAHVVRGLEHSMGTTLRGVHNKACILQQPHLCTRKYPMWGMMNKARNYHNQHILAVV
jgi:hypothetical protein